MKAVAVRRAMIQQLVRESAIKTQAELSDALIAKGIETTQATLSRDIAALGLVKSEGRYCQPGLALTEAEAAHLLKGRILAVRQAGPYMVVVVTRTGEASVVGLQMDRSGWPELVGTIAGDDTVFVACADEENNRRLIDRLREIAPEAFI